MDMSVPPAHNWYTVTPSAFDNEIHHGEFLSKSDDTPPAQPKFTPHQEIVQETHANGLWSFHNVVTPEESNMLVQVSHAVGYPESSRTVRPDPACVLIKDEFYAQYLYNRIRHGLPRTLHGKWRRSGLNQYFRIYQYRPGTEFEKHGDGPVCRSDAEMSFYSVIMYLNDSTEMQGGQTRFFSPDFVNTPVAGQYDILPKAGTCLVYNQREWLHAGVRVEAGTKYVLRTDVMYHLD